MLVRLMIMSTAALLLGFAPVPLPKLRRGEDNATLADLKALQGKWILVHSTAKGFAVAQNGTHTMSIAGRRLTFYYYGIPQSQWRITLDARGYPKEFDGQDAGLFWRGIYRLAADTLIVSYASDAGAQRPTTYSGSQPGIRVHVYHRQKP
jgi:uncharacterized protein (TIGR03067 family)